VIVVARTDPDSKHGGISLLVVERGMDGFSTRPQDSTRSVCGRRTPPNWSSRTCGSRRRTCSRRRDTGSPTSCRALPQERLSIAVGAVAGAAGALDETLRYCKEREAFGRPIGSFQNSRFVLAEAKTKVTIGQTFVDRCIVALNAGELTVDEAAMAKWWTTDLLGEVVDACVQLHGGYGYMREYPVARAYCDARVARIYGGTNEIMKEIIGRTMGV
jgi:alkylation response protein AidB-like acyl-CoA dehydrogenase